LVSGKSTSADTGLVVVVESIGFLMVFSCSFFHQDFVVTRFKGAGVVVLILLHKLIQFCVGIGFNLCGVFLSTCGKKFLIKDKDSCNKKGKTMKATVYLILDVGFSTSEMIIHRIDS